MAEVRTAGALASLKGFARRTLKRVPFAHRLAKEAVVGAKLARYRSDRRRRDHTLSPDRLWQAEKSFELPIESRDSLRNAIAAAGPLEETTGGYRVASHEDLRQAFGPLTNAYPTDATFLVLDTTDGDVAQRHAVAAAAAHADGGTRLIDLVAGQLAGSSTDDSRIWILVLEGSEGVAYEAAPVGDDFDRDAVTDSVISRHEETLHFGDVLTVVKGGERFLYQDVPGRSDPGRRDTGTRITEITEMLSRHGVEFEDRVVFDVCCNSGMMMGEALARGARWSVGWDLPRVAVAANDLLSVLGAGRSELHGTGIDNETDFVDDLPTWLAADDAICFFLAAWHHVRFPEGIRDLPWTSLVYEGQENEDPAITAANIATMERTWRCEAVESSTHSDGICGPRPLVLLQRSG